MYSYSVLLLAVCLVIHILHASAETIIDDAECAGNCHTCSGTATMCTSCDAGYLLAYDNCDTECGGNCATCTGTATTCDSCDPGFLLISNGCDTGMSCEVTCDNVMTVYADATLLATNDDWTVTTTINVPAGTSEIIIQCLDQGVAAGILASCGDELVTDNSWQCSVTGSDDWASADVVGNNGVGPWNQRHGTAISGNAKWIWHGDGNNPTNKDVTCKKSVQQVDGVIEPIIDPVVCDGGNSCCDDGNCGAGEGDCDLDTDCLPGHLCGSNNCVGDSFDATDDCCELINGIIEPEIIPGPQTPVCIEQTKVFGANIRFDHGGNYLTVINKEQCLDECDQYPDCLSIEYNAAYSKCQMNNREIGEDATGLHERWEYCPRRVWILNDSP